MVRLSKIKEMIMQLCVYLEALPEILVLTKWCAGALVVSINCDGHLNQIAATFVSPFEKEDI
jgi:hypothetical protein